MYFDQAEAKIQELDSRTEALENATGPDLSGIIADMVTVQGAVDSLNDAVAALDARLDAIAAGAEG